MITVSATPARVTIRGTYPTTSEVSYDRRDHADVIQKLLAVTPIEELAESKPLVLYFKTDKDREEFEKIMMGFLGGRMRTVRL